LTHSVLWVRRVAIVAIAIGILLRFAHLDHKVYWHDEVFTSLRVAGYLGPQVGGELFSGSTITARELLQYQHLPTEASLSQTWAALSTNPEHPPFYYLIAYGWGQQWGASIWGYRAIAAGFGVLALPLMYGLGRELFPTQPAIAWVATALLALSPVHFIYSQEAREYTLWVASMVLANWALLRAVRLQQWQAWLGYALALGLGFYSSLMTVLLGLSHLVFVGLTQKPRQGLAFVMASGLGLGLFIPWLWVIEQQWARMQSVTAWIQKPSPLSFLAPLWGLHYSAVVVDFNLPLHHSFTVLGPALLLGLVGLALNQVRQKFEPAVGLFLACLLLIPPLVLIGHDLISSGQISRTTRYFFPSLLAVYLLLAAWLVNLMAAPQPRSRHLGRLLLVGLLALGLTSITINQQATTWWNKGVSYPNAAIAQYLNQVADPLVIFAPGATSLGDAISLSYQLNPETLLWLLHDQQMPPNLPIPKTPFLVKPSSKLLNSAQSTWTLAPAIAGEPFAESDLVQLTP
jgi:uncharacterized membrane protein